MRFILLSTIALFIFISNMQAQNYEGFDAWKSGDLDAAKTAFENLHKSKKTRLVGAFGLGLVYSDDRYPEKDLKQAYDYATESRDMYKELSSKQKETLKENGLKYRPIKTLRDDILITVVNNAKNENTEEALNYAIQNFKLSYESRKEMYRLRNGAALDVARQKDSYEGYSKLFTDYERKEFTRYTPDISDEAELLLFESFIAEQGYDNLDKFKEAHPKSPFVRGGVMSAFIKALKENTAESLERFAEANEGSPMQTLALKKATLLRDEETRQEIKGAGKEEGWSIMKEWIEEDMDSSYWDLATRKMTEFKSKFSGNAEFDNLFEILSRPSESIKRKGLATVNTDGHEHSVCISTDSKTLYFCGDKRPGSIKGEDIFVTKFVNDKWSRPVIVKGTPTAGNEAPLSINVDGTRMLVFESGKIAFMDKTAKGWTKPVKLVAPINTYEWQSDAMITPDGRGMLWVIYTNGNSDIFYAERKGQNQWGTPVNLGSTINSKENERTPFLHADMRTLYFSSKGHNGLGELDVFMTTRLDDTWTRWSEPVNLGKDMNTTGNDWDYKITTDGSRAFFSSGVKDNLDLYEVELPERYRPGAVNIIESQVNVAPDKDQTVVVENAETGEIIGEYRPDPETGKITAVVPEGVKTNVRVTGEGILSRKTTVEAETSGNEVALPGTETDITSTVDVEVLDLDKAVEEGLTYSFPDLLFDYDSYEINSAFHGELDQIATKLVQSGTSITVAGHTDDQGADSYNIQLSQRRAEAVKKYLLSRGMSDGQIATEGFGESQPISDNSTDAGRAKNRRVEIIFAKQ